MNKKIAFRAFKHLHDLTKIVCEFLISQQKQNLFAVDRPFMLVVDLNRGETNTHNLVVALAKVDVGLENRLPSTQIAGRVINQPHSDTIGWHSIASEGK